MQAEVIRCSSNCRSRNTSCQSTSTSHQLSGNTGRVLQVRCDVIQLTGNTGRVSQVITGRVLQVWCDVIQAPPRVTDCRRHYRIFFPVREVNLKSYEDMILTQIAWPASGIEPEALHKQPFKLATYYVKPQGEAF